MLTKTLQISIYVLIYNKNYKKTLYQMSVPEIQKKPAHRVTNVYQIPKNIVNVFGGFMLFMTLIMFLCFNSINRANQKIQAYDLKIINLENSIEQLKSFKVVNDQRLNTLVSEIESFEQQTVKKLFAYKHQIEQMQIDYDASRQQSFQNVSTWIDSIRIQILDEVKKMLKKQVPNFKNKTSQKKNIKDKFKQTTDNLKKKFDNQFQDLKESVQDMKSILGQKMDSLKEKSGNFKKELDGKFQDLKVVVGDNFDVIKDKSSEAFDVIKDKSSEAFTNLKDKSSQAFSNLKDKSSEAFINIKSRFEELF